MFTITYISLSIIISILTLLLKFLGIGLDEKIGTREIHKKNAFRIGGLSIVLTTFIVFILIKILMIFNPF